MNLVDILLGVTYMSGLVLIGIFYVYCIRCLIVEFAEDFKVASAARQKIKDLEEE